MSANSLLALLFDLKWNTLPSVHIFLCSQYLFVSLAYSAFIKLASAIVPAELNEIAAAGNSIAVGPQFIEKTIGTIINLHERVLDAKDETIESVKNENMFLKGQQDASIYYKGYKGAGTGTLLTSLLSPIVGLIPAIATSATKPNHNNLRFPDDKLKNNPDYFMGYTKKAKKIKQGRVWLNWGIGFGVNIIASAILISSE